MKRAGSLDRATTDQLAGASISASQPCSLSAAKATKKRKTIQPRTSVTDCVACRSETTTANRLVCSICIRVYHIGCCGFDSDIFALSKNATAMLNSVGWSCECCVKNAATAFSELQANNSKLAALVTQLVSRVEKLEGVISANANGHQS
jgi:hypothetical protein